MHEDRQLAAFLDAHPELGPRTPFVLGGHDHEAFNEQIGGVCPPPAICSPCDEHPPPSAPRAHRRSYLPDPGRQPWPHSTDSR